jgi:WD40 repeat protein
MIRFGRWNIKTKLILFVVGFIFLASCSGQEAYPTPATISRPMPTMASPSTAGALSPVPILAQNVVSLSPIKEWKLYSVMAIAWSPNSSDFAIAGMSSDDNSSPTLFAYNVGDSETKWSAHAYGGLSLTYRPDGRAIAVPELFGGAFLFDATTGQDIKEIVDPVQEKGQCIGKVRIAYSPDGSKIVTMDSDFGPGQESTTIFIWDAVKNQCLGTLIDEQGSSFDFKLSSDGRFLALVLRDVRVNNDSGVLKYFGPQVQVWDIEIQRQICSFNAGNLAAGALDPNGGFIATADASGNEGVNLWDMKSCKFLYALGRTESDSNSLISMTISPDGQLLAIGSTNTIQIWRLSNRKLLFESNRLKSAVKILSFSPNGNYLLSETDRISYTDNATITLWGIKK